MRVPSRLERPQPVVIGTNEAGELIWSTIEMPLWQKKMLPIRYTGDFSAFWQKLQMLQTSGMEFDCPNMAEIKAFVPGELAAKYKKAHLTHKGD